LGNEPVDCGIGAARPVPAYKPNASKSTGTPAGEAEGLGIAETAMDGANFERELVTTGD
jgi:hypothetical protein